MIPGPLTLLRRAASICREKIRLIIQLGSIVLLIGIFQLISIEIHSTALFVSSILSGIVVSYIVYIAMIRAISSPDKISLGKLFEESQPYVMPSIWVSIIMVLVVCGGFLLLVVPGIIALGFLSFSLMASVIDGYKKHEALMQSWSLVKSRWWQIFWRFLVANIIIGLVGGAISFILWLCGVGQNPFQFISVSGNSAAGVSFGQAISNQIVSNFFVVPMSIAYNVVFYEELKRLPRPAISESDRTLFMSRLHFLAGAGVAYVVAGIFVFGLFMAHFLPNVVNATHTPAAVFEAL